MWIFSAFAQLTIDMDKVLILIYVFFSQCGYSSPTQAAITKDLGLTVSEVKRSHFYLRTVLFFL